MCTPALTISGKQSSLFPKGPVIGRFYARDVNVVSDVKAVSRQL